VRPFKSFNACRNSKFDQKIVDKIDLLSRIDFGACFGGIRDQRKLDHGWLYLAGLNDVFTCEIVGYAMGVRMTRDLTAQALWRAVANKCPAPGLIHHSDRGSQYCAHAYRDLVAQFGMRASMSRKGNCYDNAPMESFWSTLKNELVHHRRYATHAEAQVSIQEYIKIFYNRQRRHSRIGFVPPALFAEEFSKQPQAA
jgi:putative transposase